MISDSLWFLHNHTKWLTPKIVRTIKVSQIFTVIEFPNIWHIWPHHQIIMCTNYVWRFCSDHFGNWPVSHITMFNAIIWNSIALYFNSFNLNYLNVAYVCQTRTFKIWLKLPGCVCIWMYSFNWMYAHTHITQCKAHIFLSFSLYLFTNLLSSIIVSNVERRIMLQAVI